MSLDADNYSLSEFMRLTHRADRLIFGLSDLESVDDGKLHGKLPWETMSGYSSCRSYTLTGEVADDARRLFDAGDDDKVILSTRRFGDIGNVHWLMIKVGRNGQIFEDRNEHARADNLFQSLVGWLDEELKRKDWKDSGHAGTLFEGAL